MTQGSISPAEAPRRVVVAEVPMQVDAEEMKGLFSSEKGAASKESISSAVDRAQRLALVTLKASLRSMAGIEVDDGAPVRDAVQDLGFDSENPLTPSELLQLRAATHADALLRFRITDYGVTPRAWRKGVIIFEVASTLGIAGLAYAYPKTRPVAGIYLLEEGVEETLEYYGGLWALDKVCRPVRIEAELIPLKSGATAWRSVATGLSDIALGRLVHPVGEAERDAQLDAALVAAGNRIASDLANAIAPGRATSPSDGHAVAF